MSKIVIQNLNILVTDNCNFNCEHCMRGEGNNYIITDEIIDSIFSQVDVISNLNLEGGEVLQYPGRIRKIFKTIIDKNIILGSFGITTNGTLYSEYIDSLYDELEKYVSKYKKNFLIPKYSPSGYLALSFDVFHKIELSKINKNDKNIYDQYMECITKLLDSKYFMQIRILEKNIFNEGNGKNLDLEEMKNVIKILYNQKKIDKNEYKKFLNLEKIELEKMQLYRYLREDGLLEFGPCVSIGRNGIITEPNGSYETLEEKFNYGNVLDNNLIDVLINISEECTKDKEYDKKTKEAIKEYMLK